MNNEQYNPKELADKWLRGTITEAEKAWFDTWYAGFNDEEALVSTNRHQSPDGLKSAIFERISAQMDLPVKTAAPVYQLWKHIAAAAAVLLIIGVSALYRNNILNVIDPVKQITIASTGAQHRQVTLPDGTRIWLSPSTTISYPDKFRGKQRNITLEGEAFMDVVHDTDQPFIIQSGGIKTAVLGTSFNVRAYARARVAEVTVVSGKVAVATSLGGKYQQQIMIANQRAVYRKNTGTLLKENYLDAAKFLDQRHGIYDFKGASLQTVLAELETQYGVTISLENSLAEKAFYGHLKTTDPIAVTLNKLSTVMEIQWTKTGDHYHLQKPTVKN